MLHESMCEHKAKEAREENPPSTNFHSSMHHFHFHRGCKSGRTCTLHSVSQSVFEGGVGRGDLCTNDAHSERKRNKRNKKTNHGVERFVLRTSASVKQTQPSYACYVLGLNTHTIMATSSHVVALGGWNGWMDGQTDEGSWVAFSTLVVIGLSSPQSNHIAIRVFFHQNRATFISSCITLIG